MIERPAWAELPFYARPRAVRMLSAQVLLYPDGWARATLNRMDLGAMRLVPEIDSWDRYEGNLTYASAAALTRASVAYHWQVWAEAYPPS